MFEHNKNGMVSKDKLKQLSEAQLKQRKQAQSMAMIARRRKQLSRLDLERREVIQKLVEAGVKVEVEPVKPVRFLVGKVEPENESQSTGQICSAAGIALRRCAAAKRAARRARNK